MAVVEREPQIDVQIKRDGDSGVVMETTLTTTTVREEAFVDEEHLQNGLKHRINRKLLSGMLKLYGTPILAIGIGSFGVLSLPKDINNSDLTGTAGDCAEFALAAGLMYSTLKNNTPFLELDIAEKQKKATNKTANVVHHPTVNELS